MRLPLSAAFAAALSAVALSAAAAPMGVALVDGGAAVARIADLAKPAMGAATALRDPAGKAVTLSAITWRPSSGALFGFSAATDTVYAVDATSGVATPAATLAGAVDGPAGFDFNNMIDAARIVSAAGDNLVFFPKNEPNEIKRFTKLFYVDGDANVGKTPRVFANAYTNAVPAASATQQYVVDAATNALATLANNTGELRTVGTLTLDGVALDVLEDGDLDILSLREGDNRAYAVLKSAQGAALYSLALAKDATGGVPLRRIAAMPAGVVGIAVFDSAAARPAS